MKKINFKKLTWRFVELSTAHITKDDDNRLAHELHQLIVHDLDPGWLIYIPRRRDDPDFWDQLAASAFSPALRKLLKKVSAEGFRYLRLDPDAKTHPGLPTFEW